MTRSASLILSLALVVASGCGGGDGGPTGTGNNVALTGDGNIRATINGVAWRSTKGADRVSKSGQIYAIVGLNLPYALTLGLAPVTGPGTISLNLATSNGSSAIVSNATGGWGTAFAGGSGTVVITVLTANRIAGTFSFDAVPGSGAAAGTMQVRNGTFDVAF
jgi:Family of unknown function (DUF6252)